MCDKILIDYKSNVFLMQDGLRKEEKLLKGYLFRHFLRWSAYNRELTDPEDNISFAGDDLESDIARR